MSRRSFDHFHAELSVEIGRLVPRYALWLEVRELGLDPGELGAADLVALASGALDPFLAFEGLILPDRARRRLVRRLRRYDPALATPYEVMERLFARADEASDRTRR